MRGIVELLLILFSISFTASFFNAHVSLKRRHQLLQCSATYDADDTPISRDFIHAKLSDLISSHSILLFMKGSPEEPQCGYSRSVVQIFNHLSVPFHAVNVLEDDRIREGIKRFSDWPTIPQLYVLGAFVGGADIVIEMFQNGELQEMLEVAAAS